ncbi:MAG: 2-succinyl-5-enolpyruvyl-6-hydroxy-3-cyclohexene-1-carboxylic-acid synthase [Actinomycetota bacterium]|nr:2-succinyl-5-enolpyruvyl-6-hydroxy-3-cyclohexene-1-carboxylic-acid synthase [Euzebyales bacterium]MDQ3528835.1 2-succinyl-5-enolpyruvyl-6-hydroxy-3-cyclohexene-1-carboxylic-acid synthase [Actinomycetota bacterium]
MNPSTALATVMVDEFARHGVVHAVLSPGSRSAPLALALHADDRVRLHVRIDERSAAFFALGLAKASGTPVIVACTSGTAAANLHPAVVEADLAGVGLLVLTADRPPELRGTGANQTIDQLGLYGGAVRWFCEVGTPDAAAGSEGYWRSMASRAAGEARGASGRPPGPVHLNLTFREPLAPAGDEASAGGRGGDRPWTRTAVPDVVASEAVTDELTREASAATRGLLVVGDTAADPEPLLDLAEVAAWPVLAEPQSGARTGAQAITTYDLLLRDDAFAAAHRPDLVITVGKVALSKALLAWLSPDARQILVDPHGAWLDPRRALAQVITADPGPLAASMTARLAPRLDRTWLDGWLEAEGRVRTAIDEALDAAQAPNEPRTARDLAALVPHGAVLTVASSMPVRDLNSFAAARRGLRIFGNRGASGIDGFCSTALGVAAASDGPAFALAGDLSLLHDQNGLLPVPGGLPDLVLVVINNDGGGIFNFLYAGHPAFEAVFGTPHGVDLGRLAAGLDVGHRRLDRAGDLGDALTVAGAGGGVQLIEVRTDRDANLALHQRLSEIASAALS